MTAPGATPGSSASAGTGVLPGRLPASIGPWTLGRRVWGLLWGTYSDFVNVGYRIPLETLSLYRIFFALYLLVMNPIPDLRWIAAYPGEFHDPAPGLMNIWPGFPPTPVLIALEAGTVLVACLLAIGWRTAWTSVALTTVGLLANSVYMSFGKIDHTAVMWFLPGLMAASGWGSFWSYDRVAADRGKTLNGSGLRIDSLYGEPGTARSPGWPAAAAAVMLGIAFLSAGLPKVVKGWLSFESSGSLGYLRELYFGLDRNRLLANTFINIETPALWEVLDWSTVALELSLAVVFLWARAYRCALFTAWVFHVSVMAIMNIPFFGPTPIYALFFLALINPTRSHRIGSWLMARRRLLIPLLLPAALAALMGRGVYLTTVVDGLGLSMALAEFAYFVVGMAALVVVLIRSRGFTRSF